LLTDADSIDRKIEKLRIGVLNRNLAQANFAAAEASVDRIARVLTWIRSFIAATPRDEHQATVIFPRSTTQPKNMVSTETEIEVIAHKP
jgi:hypothetical protein